MAQVIVERQRPRAAQQQRHARAQQCESVFKPLRQKEAVPQMHDANRHERFHGQHQRRIARERAEQQRQTAE
jgi:hypothetical protein